MKRVSYRDQVKESKVIVLFFPRNRKYYSKKVFQLLNPKVESIAFQTVQTKRNTILGRKVE